MRTLPTLFAVSLGALATACASDSLGNPTISCDQSTMDAHACVDYACVDTDASEVEHACQMISGASAGQGCALAGAIGGCTLSTPNAGQAGLANCKRTLWFYSLAASDVMAICGTLGGAFVTP
jgi:hypothetical protein